MNDGEERKNDGGTGLPHPGSTQKPTAPEPARTYKGGGPAGPDTATLVSRDRSPPLPSASPPALRGESYSELSYVPAGPTMVISWPSADKPSECRSSSVFQAITIPPVRSR